MLVEQNWIYSVVTADVNLEIWWPFGITNWGDGNAYVIFLKSLRGWEHLEDQCVDWRIILKFILGT